MDSKDSTVKGVDSLLQNINIGIEVFPNNVYKLLEELIFYGLMDLTSMELVLLLVVVVSLLYYIDCLEL